ncbi:hypothetical protein FGG08_002310 [Glutinoglossum americanum]|uniref:Elongator complex protein 2 n=1 Tax=Glutinoglossum americanum TaxID=1670608 RepID=A0A9P8L4L0_9PEZI|nr:hypothetical protein FGG08_002310 [Glutinoglossum americanum]
MARASTDFIAIGGNRHPSAADWDTQSGLLAFGADRNVAIWNPLDEAHHGITALLSGHTGKVNVVKFLPTQSAGQIIISGSVDKTIRIWQRYEALHTSFAGIAILRDHESSINAIAVQQGSNIFVSGSADATARIWKIDSSKQSELKVELLQTINITPRFFPLAVAFSALPASPRSFVLAVAGTRNIIQIYVADPADGKMIFKLQASLAGHEGWIRALTFTCENDRQSPDLLLASASQDKYIRLWRIHEGEELPPAITAGSGSALGTLAKSLSNKAHRFGAGRMKYSVTFEALLLGHEDWVYTASWRPNNEGKAQLLSASADNSMTIWEPDASSGIWVSVARLGEISATKGSTTATGSTGGFWVGLWSPTGEAVASLGRTGSWRLWNYDRRQDLWLQGVAVSGHVKDVMGISWGKDGKYLLSTGSDQTTRLYAEWKRGQRRSWHEFSRPQIHGYDLNCIDSLGSSQFISGADEKLLRVFDKPKTIAHLLERLCGIKEPRSEELPDAANIPVLGLSNKAIQAVDELLATNGGAQEALHHGSVAHNAILDLDYPPLEDHLARHTLWPEREKLYGHGYEISAVTSSYDGSLVATACKASSINHAVIRLFKTKEWHEVKPPLVAHSLTVTSLRFSEDDQYLLSVGRDRQWVVFKRDLGREAIYKLSNSNPKGHSRMILEAAWGPVKAGRIFATAGRDKLVSAAAVNIWVKMDLMPALTQVKIWGAQDAMFFCKNTITSSIPVTAVDFLRTLVGGKLCLAYGTEDGGINIFGSNPKDLMFVKLFVFDTRFAAPPQFQQLVGLDQNLTFTIQRYSIKGYYATILEATAATPNN